MQALAAIIFDFDGVLADCRRGILLPGAFAFATRAAGVIPLGIASGAMTGEIVDILERHHLRNLFAAIVGADQTARSKPSPDPYLEALARLAVGGTPLAAARTVAIDDSAAGLVAARTAGLRCVGIAGAGRRAELARYAEVVVPGLEALTLDMLDTLVVGSGDRR
jgi:beta-phosphoglucomutase-like phosphatase (HAD superfamily)